MSGVVVDTSAAVAILTAEDGAEDLLSHLARADTRLMSTATLVEVGIVLESRIGPAASGIVERFLRDAGIELVAVDRTHVDRALEGWRRFGKGRHPAGLDLGDLFPYALAVTASQPVLCTGDDLASTDVGVLRATEITATGAPSPKQRS